MLNEPINGSTAHGRRKARCMTGRPHLPTKSRPLTPAVTLYSVGDLGLRLAVPAKWHTHTIYRPTAPTLFAQIPKFDITMLVNGAAALWRADFMHRGPRMQWGVNRTQVCVDDDDLQASYMLELLSLVARFGWQIRFEARRSRRLGALRGYLAEFRDTKRRRDVRLFYGHELGKPTVILKADFPVGTLDENLIQLCWRQVRYLTTEVIEPRVTHG